MIRAVADTHALVWYIHSDPRMSPAARAAMDDAAAAGDEIAVSSISFVEMTYLIEKRRIDPKTIDRISILLDFDSLLIEVPVHRAIAAALQAIARAEVPDMPDRIIAATALHLGVPVISRDGKIRASSVATIW